MDIREHEVEYGSHLSWAVILCELFEFPMVVTYLKVEVRGRVQEIGCVIDKERRSNFKKKGRSSTFLSQKMPSRNRGSRPTLGQGLDREVDTP